MSVRLEESIPLSEVIPGRVDAEIEDVERGTLALGRVGHLDRVRPRRGGAGAVVACGGVAA